MSNKDGTKNDSKLESDGVKDENNTTEDYQNPQTKLPCIHIDKYNY